MRERSDLATYGTRTTQDSTDRTVHPHGAVGPGTRASFYTKLNAVLAEAGFDGFVEQLCAPHYKDGGRARPATGHLLSHALHRLLRGDRQPARHRLALRRQPRPCAASWAMPLTEAHARACLDERDPPAPARGRSSTEVFQLPAQVAGQAKGLLKGRTLGIDATTLEANAAMKSIVRKDSGAGLEGLPAEARQSRRHQGARPPPTSSAWTARARTKRSPTKIGRARATPTRASRG